jgi:cyclase
METMRRIRVIPVLGIDKGRLVKTVSFKNPNYIGDPLNAIKIFNDKEVDELVMVDIRATVNGTEPDYSLIADMAGECFMPLAYGGGIRTADQAKRIFDLGVEKVIINSHFLEHPALVTELAAQYGAQSIVVCLDVDKNMFGKLRVKGSSGSKKYELTPEEAAVQAEQAGAGELVLHAIYKDGRLSGYDIPLIHSVASRLNIPLVALGGARGTADMLEAVQAGASAVAASATFVYNRNDTRSILINYPNQKTLSHDIFQHL